MSYDGIRIDTHTFKGSYKDLAAKDTSSFFELPRFDKTRFIPIIFEDFRDSNVIDEIIRNPRFLGCNLIFNPNPDRRFGFYTDINELKQATKHPYVVGLKAHPPISDIPINSAKFFPLYEHASETGLPLLVHCSASGEKYSSAKMIEEVCSSFPDLKLILAHFGGNNSVYMKRAVDLTEKYQNLYLNTTAIDPLRTRFRICDGVRKRIPPSETREDIFKIFLNALQRTPSKILFGSDLGFYKPEGIDDDPDAQYLTWPIDKLSTRDQKRIFFENPLRLYRKIDRTKI